jgi:ABC-2 type transport system ATP-binding protein
LLQELDIHELEQNRRRRLLLRTRDNEAARRALTAAGQPAEILENGSIELTTTYSVEHPEDINRLLTVDGIPPTQLMVEEEDLELYFLRLVGTEREEQNE